MYKTVSSTDPLPDESGKEFWERRYRNSPFSSSDPIRKPRQRLKEFVTKLQLKPGIALDIGCGRGEDSIWLAAQGWAALGVDVSRSAIEQARLLAEHFKSEITGRIEFVCYDLGYSFPLGKYDLISAQFFESPVPFGRDRILKKAANHVNENGILLITSHASRPPWSWPMRYSPPSPEEALAALSLDLKLWEKICVDDLSRIAIGPKGEKALVRDTVICLRRR